MKNMIRQLSVNIILGLCVLFFSTIIQAQTTTFTFQGRLSDNNLAASGTYEMQFTLFDAASGGNQIGQTISNANISVINGIFTVNLDFGANSFSGASRFLQISVRAAGNPNPHTLLNPRQPITSAPYSIWSLFSLNADIAANSNQLGGINANQYVLTGDTRLSDFRDPNPGSTFYVQNRTSVQTNTNFNISGNGTAGIFNATTQFNINNNRVLSIAGTQNLFAGMNTGVNNSGFNNSFVGFSAGQLNTNAISNSFFGSHAGENTTTGGQNTFVGVFAGSSNTDGGVNVFFGVDAGRFNTTGDGNVFIGWRAGDTNTTGSTNIAIGAGSDVGSTNLQNAVAIGAGSVVQTSNTIVLGTSQETVNIPGKLTLSTLDSAGNTALCRNSLNRISTCSSSLRYKTNIAPFSYGLTFINQLRPISYDWKDGGMKDVGFGAEDVAEINPLFVNYNDKGEVEGVKYDRFSVLFVNAFKEQQTQIEKQQKQIEMLKQIVCQDHPQAEICREEK